LPATVRKILVVDDDYEMRYVLRLMFEVEEYEVVGEAIDGIEAIDLAGRLRPDFVILDFSMPRMNGAVAAPLIRKAAPGTRIVAFSAILDSKPAWADAFLNKDRIGDVAPLLGTLISAPAQV
jgi:DNA-binding NarL/FixJ family response regulator